MERECFKTVAKIYKNGNMSEDNLYEIAFKEITWISFQTRNPEKEPFLPFGGSNV